MAYRSRDMLVRLRTQLINALRGHLTEFGVVAMMMCHLNLGWPPKRHGNTWRLKTL
jgi:hypothetical protein